MENNDICPICGGKKILEIKNITTGSAYACRMCNCKNNIEIVENGEIIKVEGKNKKTNLEKIKTLTGWMNDLDPCFYQVQAQYVVALALFNYIETLGMFLVGYYKKDQKTNKKKLTSSRERFESFFSYLGLEYENLVNMGKCPVFKIDVYDELRNGFTHELIPKKYNFTVFHVGGENDWHNKNSEEKERIRKEKIENLNLNCGVIFNISNKKWLIFVNKLLYDFNIAKNKLINKIEKGDERLRKNFEEVAEAINLKNFII